MNFKLDGCQICIVHDMTEHKPLGTGFIFLRNDWIVTAAHVVMEQGLPRKKLYVSFASPRFALVEVEACHFENDIAILKIQGTSPCTMPLFPGNEPLSGAQGLIYAGYSPSQSDLLSKKIIVSHVSIYNKEIRERDGNELILEFESSDVEGGYSGGPIFGNGGVILGILIQHFTPEERKGKKLARATSINNVLAGITFELNKNVFKELNI